MDKSQEFQEYCALRRRARQAARLSKDAGKKMLEQETDKTAPSVYQRIRAELVYPEYGSCDTLRANQILAECKY